MGSMSANAKMEVNVGAGVNLEEKWAELSKEQKELLWAVTVLVKNSGICLGNGGVGMGGGEHRTLNVQLRTSNVEGKDEGRPPSPNDGATSPPSSDLGATRRGAAGAEHRSGSRMDENGPTRAGQQLRTGNTQREEEGERFVFRKAGRVWKVVFEGGEEFHVADTLGARYLDRLLHQPNRAMSAYDLEIGVTPEKERVRMRNSGNGGMGADATRSYLRELERLRGEREVAAEEGQVDRVERIDSEIEAVEAAVRRAAGNGGDAGERARNNVRKAIGAAVAHLRRGGKEERQFGEHVKRCVSTGYECVYAQPEGNIWR